MSQRSTYLDRLQDELMAAGRRLQHERPEPGGTQTSGSGSGAALRGRAAGMADATTAHGRGGSVSGRPTARGRHGAPRRRRPAALALAAAGALAAAAALALTLTGQPAGTQDAYAGWTASPTAPANGQIAGAEAICRAAIAKTEEMTSHAHGTVEGGGQPGGAADPHEPQAVHEPSIAPGEWHTVLSDTRGPYTMLIFEADEGRAKETCLTGNGSLLSTSGSYEPSTAPARSGAISVFSDGSAAADPQAGRPEPFHYISGRTGAGVTSVSVELANGTQVQASVMGGWYLAWWPGTQKALSAQVTGTGATTSTVSLGR